MPLEILNTDCKTDYDSEILENHSQDFCVDGLLGFARKFNLPRLNMRHEHYTTTTDPNIS